MYVCGNSFSYRPGFITVRLFPRSVRANICLGLVDAGGFDFGEIFYDPNYCLSIFRVY